VIFVVGGTISGLLYRRYNLLLRQLRQQSTEPPPQVQNFGSAVLTFSNSPSSQKEYLRTVVLNKLTVEDFSLDVVEVKGEKKPFINLSVSFNYQGKDRRVVIPIVDDILLRKPGPEQFEEGEVTSVASLNLEKGRLINVAFSYLPIETTVKKQELVVFCERTDYKECLMYIELGFGGESIEFNSYLESIFKDSDEASVDYTLVFPNTIYVLAN